ncbi:MAG: PLP-dependent aminotransferase family protein [Peptostreptococcaceae bacterium]|nr:PLP-dependent aminotransferase family protein [Peptostreptococcaceae bacterium]
MNYTRSEGCLRHRRIAADWLSRYGLSASPDHTLITAGAMHAINCCLMSLFRRGDKIAVDEFTFPGFKSAADFHCVKCLPVSCDEEGMLPSALEKLCEKESLRGIYLMPHLQNPTTAAMSPRRRLEIAERIRRFNLILLEDDIYNWLHPESEESLSSLVPERSVFICGISKSLCPGLRIAFLQSDPCFFPSLNKAISTTMWMAPPSRRRTDLPSDRKRESRPDLRTEKREPAEKMPDRPGSLLGYGHPYSGSEPVLLAEPPSVDSDGLEHLALLHRIRLLSSSKFYASSSGRTQAVRVALGAIPSSEQLRAGLESLRNRIRNYESLSSVM